MKLFSFATTLLAAGLLLSVPTAFCGADAEEIYVSPQDPFLALEALADSRGFQDPREEFVLERQEDVAYGKVYRFSQQYEGKEVSGREVILSVDEKGKLLSVNSSYLPLSSVPEATLSEEDLLTSENCSVKETVYTLGKGAEPAFEVTGQGEVRYLSARSGELLASYPLSTGAMVRLPQTNALGEEIEIGVFDGESGYALHDELRNITVYDMQGGTNVWRRSEYRSAAGEFEDLAVSAYDAVVRAYDFYADPANIGVSRKGMDGQSDDVAGNETEQGELPVWILLHYGIAYENANFYYDTDYGAAELLIGDGSPTGSIYRQAAACDVLAHEYQHGVTHFTANLYYLNDSGAIDEAMSDIFGSLIEGKDPSDDDFWAIGENAVPKGDYLRSAIRPDDGYRLNLKRRVPACRLNHSHENCDYGGVHDNSTILTHMQYNLWRKLPNFFTRERIGTLWYSTLLTLTQNATFEEFALRFREAAVALGYNETAMRAVDEALFESGLSGAENAHLVTFTDSNGDVVEETCVRDGGTVPLPTPPGPVYTREEVFCFDGWEGALSPITRDTTITARYRSEPRSYQVTFLDALGELLLEETVPYGTAAPLPSPPEKQPTAFYDYDFVEWTGGDASFVNSDLVLTPRYRQVRCYTVTFLDEEGFSLFTSRVREGETANPPELPVKESTREHVYLFDRWDRSLENVRSDLTVKAIFREELRHYTVLFLSDGKVLSRESVPYGVRPYYPDLTGRARTSGERFSGWYFDEACTRPAATSPIGGDLTLYAGWRKTETVPAESGCNGSACGTLMLLPLFFLFIKRRKQRPAASRAAKR